MVFHESQGIFQGGFYIFLTQPSTGRFCYQVWGWSSLPWERFVLAIFLVQLAAGNTGNLTKKKEKKKLFLEDFPFQVSRPKGLRGLKLDNHRNRWALVQAAATSAPIVAWPPPPQLPAQIPPAFHCFRGCKLVFLHGCVKRRKGLKETL